MRRCFFRGYRFYGHFQAAADGFGNIQHPHAFFRHCMIFRARIVLFQREPVKTGDIRDVGRCPAVASLPHICGDALLSRYSHGVSQEPLPHCVVSFGADGPITEGRARLGGAASPSSQHSAARAPDLRRDLEREKRVSAYVGEGRNRWAAAHVSDVARLYRLALEKNDAGAKYHAVAEEGVRMLDIAEAIGRGLKVPVKSIAAEEAPAHFGWLAMFASYDLMASSEKTRETLGWNPTGPGLIADLERVEVLNS